MGGARKPAPPPRASPLMQQGPLSAKQRDLAAQAASAAREQEAPLKAREAARAEIVKAAKSSEAELDAWSQLATLKDMTMDGGWVFDIYTKREARVRRALRRALRALGGGDGAGPCGLRARAVAACMVGACRVAAGATDPLASPSPGLPPPLGASPSKQAARSLNPNAAPPLFPQSTFSR